MSGKAGLNPCCNGRWSLTSLASRKWDCEKCVLILVVMEDGLWLPQKRLQNWKSLNPCCNGRWSLTPLQPSWASAPSCLNPCCNGRWSLTTRNNIIAFWKQCLNPCCNGRWSLTYYENKDWRFSDNVLILVVMEDGLWLTPKWWARTRKGLNPCCNGRWSLTEYVFHNLTEWMSLNPCCNGRWSLTETKFYDLQDTWVLILVVMEDGLWPANNKYK